MTHNTDHKVAVHILALCRFSGVKPRLLEVLIRHYGSIERIFQADAGSLMAIGGMTAEIANRIAKAGSHLAEAGQYYGQLLDRDIDIVTRFDNNYPHRLLELNDPPTHMFYRGSLPSENGRMVALAGGRNATSEGIELTVEAARRFAEADVQIVSSLHKGIDSAAHVGCRAGNGKSYSVLQGGLDNIYPEDSRPLAVDIAKNGGLLSESAPEEKFSEDGYKASNRLIAGLSQAVVTTEAYHDSHEALDLLKCCSQIGKLAFIIIDPRHGALTDKESFNLAITYGAIPMVGLDKIDEIIQSLV